MNKRKSYYYEFGPFRLDVADLLLTRNGEVVALTPNVFDLLVLLVENNGHLLEKDYLLETLWPDSIVDETNLVTNISALRRALGETSSDPLYIQTVPKRGYRFVASVKKIRVDEGEPYSDQPSLASRATLADAYPETLANEPTQHLTADPLGRRLRHGMIMAMVGLTLFVLGAGLLLYRHSRNPAPPPPPAKPRVTIAVLGFKNLSEGSNGAWLSAALMDMFNTELAAGGAIRTVPGEQVALSKMELSLPDTDTFSKDTLARIRMSLNTDYVIVGSYLVTGEKKGRKVRLDARLQDAAIGETVCAVTETGTETELLELVTRHGVELRKKLNMKQLPLAGN